MSDTSTLLTLDLLERSSRSLHEAALTQVGRERFLKAQLSALRAAAALVRGRPIAPAPRRAGLWEALGQAAPELREWAAYFAASGRRARLALREPSVPVSPRDADDLLRAAQTFAGLVADRVGAPLDDDPLRLAPLTR